MARLMKRSSMMYRRAGTWFMAVIATGALIAGAQAAPPTGVDVAPRVRLDLTPAQQEALKFTMREHLEALEAIVAALGRADYATAADLAHIELGFPKHHEAMQRERGATLPKRYQELAMAHHQAAEELAKAITAKKMPLILERLAKTIRACTACHGAYTLK